MPPVRQKLESLAAPSSTPRRHRGGGVCVCVCVCALIAERQALGIAKYGTTVADNPLTLCQWLQHALEECLDQAIYLKRAIEELK